MPPGMGSVRKPVQAERQRARSSLEQHEVKIVSLHRTSPHRKRGSHAATLPSPSSVGQWMGGRWHRSTRCTVNRVQ